jgi:hypothetical protein|tara:strand:+ start:107 stop:448 length:342 start_codon:yes stop_codon:yes gene_type:complete
MITNMNHHVPAGHTITVSVVDGSAHVEQVESPAVAALVTNAAAQTFGPYMLDRTFRVQERAGVTVTVSEADIAANIPSADQAATLDAIPTTDQEDSATVWSDEGVLKVSGAGV